MRRLSRPDHPSRAGQRDQALCLTAYGSLKVGGIRRLHVGETCTPKNPCDLKEGEMKPRKLRDSRPTSCKILTDFLISPRRAALPIAVLAVNRAALCGLEWHFAFLSTVGARCFVHLSGASVEAAPLSKTHSFLSLQWDTDKGHVPPRGYTVLNGTDK